MRREMMDILVCPQCKSELKLNVTKEENDEIIAGSLVCQGCDESYPIENAIPNLLPPELRA